MEIILIVLSIIICVLCAVILYFSFHNRGGNTQRIIEQVVYDKMIQSSKDIQFAVISALKDEVRQLTVETLQSQGVLKENTLERLAAFELSINKRIEEFQSHLLDKNGAHQEVFRAKVQTEFSNLKDSLQKSFEKLMVNTEEKLTMISGKVDERLEKGFEKTMVTFQNVLQRLTKIDEAQKKIENLSNEVVDLQMVLTDKKSRGVFGEVLLSQVIASIFGEKNEKLYQLQAGLENGSQKVIADAIIHMPKPLGLIAIDSKFPLENYRKMLDRNLEDSIRAQAEKDFKANFKKHVVDISEKYIIPNKTGDMAILFLPAESIFAEVTAYHEDLIDFARSKKVWIASPTTLMAFLSTLQMVVKDMETSRQAGIIQSELKALSKDFQLFTKRWSDLTKHIKNVSTDIDKLDISSSKILRKFEKIENVQLEELTDEKIFLD